MPTERFSDEMLKKFEIKHGEGKKEKPKWKDGSVGWYLVPNRRDERTKTLECTPEQWQTVFRLSKEGSLHLYEGDPFTTDKVRQLVRAIKKAITKKPVTDSDTQLWVDEFLAFLVGEGQFGFTLSREWRRVRGK